MSDIEIIKATSVFLEIAQAIPGVEVWPDKDFSDGGFSYFWVVVQNSGASRILSYIRCKSGACEQRTYDTNGDDLWIPIA